MQESNVEREARRLLRLSEVQIMKAVDDTPAVTRTFEVTIPCPHCRRLLDVFLKEAS